MSERRFWIAPTTLHIYAEGLDIVIWDVLLWLWLTCTFLSSSSRQVSHLYALEAFGLYQP